jgi:predicted Ser/Thr protein kinase
MITKKQAEKICDELGFDFQKISFLASGNHNQVFLLQTKQKKLVLKLQHHPKSGNLSAEYSILKKLNGVGAPNVYLFDKSCKILSQTYVVEGQF